MGLHIYTRSVIKMSKRNENGLAHKYLEETRSVSKRNEWKAYLHNEPSCV